MRAWLHGSARLLSILGAVASIGAGGWLLGGVSANGDRALARRWWRGAATLFLVGSTLEFVLRSGSVWLLSRVAAATVLFALTFVWQQRRARWWRGIAIATGLFAMATFPLATHASSLHPRWLWIAIGFMHLAAIVVWIGGLVALLVDGHLAGRFAKAAVVCLPLIVGTGALQTWKLADGFHDVAASDWGRVLLVKVTLVVMLLALAGVSRWVLLHDGASSIRRTVAVEVTIGVIVLGLAASMVGLSPERAVAAQPFATQLASNGMIVDVSVEPGSIGNNEVHVFITPPGGSIVPVVAAAARVALADEAVPSAPVQLTGEGPNHYSGVVTFSQGGDWTLDVIIEVTPGETVLVSATVPIP